MIISMTGYGRSEVAWSGGTVTAELRSVNHRFCEIVVRLPKALSSLEEELKRTIQQCCARGRIELTVSLSGGKETGKQLSLDQALARQYHSLLRDLKKQLRRTSDWLLYISRSRFPDRLMESYPRNTASRPEDS